jgi:hypothetical protein
MDASILAHLARYHAKRLRATAQYVFHQKTGEPPRIVEALSLLQSARAEWASLVGAAEPYHSNLIFGRESFRHTGHWRDWFDVIDKDIERLHSMTVSDDRQESCESAVTRVAAVLESDERPKLTVDFSVPQIAPADLDLSIRIQASSNTPVIDARCFHRNTNQALDFEAIELTRGQQTWEANIPTHAIPHDWDLMIFFEFDLENGTAVRWPDWRERAPYFIIETCSEE